MQPLFIDSSAGRLFAVYWPAVGENVCGKAILYIPAFAEEMNRSRRMVALQARAFSKLGYAVLVLDLFGTGDSAGEFGEATWENWLQNIDVGIDWLTQRGMETIALWGLRVGALLAMDYASRSRYSIQRLIAWQPVLNGEVFITQFLRLRIAAAMINNNAPREKTAGIKQQLLAGQAVEVAGYSLNPDLIKPLLALRADRLTWQGVNEIAIFEVLPEQDNPAAAANAQLLALLQQHSINATLATVVGGSFWIGQESSEAPDLIKLTCASVGQWL